MNTRYYELNCVEESILLPKFAVCAEGGGNVLGGFRFWTSIRLTIFLAAILSVMKIHQICTESKSLSTVGVGASIR